MSAPNSSDALHDATRVVRAGLPHPSVGSPYMQGPTFAATYHTPGDPAAASFAYGRFDNPTWRAYESALESLEGGPVTLFSSGMAATVAVLSVVLAPGAKVVLPSDCYYTTRRIAAEHFAPLGIELVMAPTADDAQAALLHGAALLWLESPTNPSLDVCDIARLCTLAHEASALVAVDNTTATVLAQRPLALGADFVVMSDTKAMCGHADVLLGHVACRDATWAERIRTWRTRMGSIPGPMEVWLAHRSLGTLDVRLARQCESAMTIASFLGTHPAVMAVRYPGLPSDPSHAVASRQMARFGPVVSFTLRDQPAAERFFERATLVHEATSFGGIHTSAERRARWGGDDVPAGFIRLSVGVEDIRDLLTDITAALDHARDSNAQLLQSSHATS
ncbi:MAG TPA: cystathionine gamma-lyase [Gemmatimonas sp.]|nr:cystathionine gamma-lyase [Gemmatimonas sp.]